MCRAWQAFCGILLFSVVFRFQVLGQTGKPESADEVLIKGEIVAGNIQTAILMHTTDEPDFKNAKQLPDDSRPLPKVLVLKNGDWYFDWTPGQHARYLMEELRQGLHAIQSVEKPRGIDIVALTGAREYWPKLRDISCRESPGTRYYDLDGFAQFCPTK